MLKLSKIWTMISSTIKLHNNITFKVKIIIKNKLMKIKKRKKRILTLKIKELRISRNLFRKIGSTTIRRNKEIKGLNQENTTETRIDQNQENMIETRIDQNQENMIETRIDIKEMK
jgi:hypothetical protein